MRLNDDEADGNGGGDDVHQEWRTHCHLLGTSAQANLIIVMMVTLMIMILMEKLMIIL